MPKRGSTGRFELKPMQERVLRVLNADGSELLTRARYEEITGVSRSQAAYDLAELVEAGILDRLGGGRATRYRLKTGRPGRKADRPGRRHWTSERIRSELERFCAERKTWPSPAEFRAAGHSDLYVAASRYGGLGFWASELGFSRPGRTEPPARAPVRPRRRFRPRLQWLASAAVVVVALGATAGAGFQAWDGIHSLGPGASLQANAPTFVPERTVASAAKAKPSKLHLARKAQRAEAKPRVTHAGPAQTVQTPAAPTELAAVRTPAPTYTAPKQPVSTPRSTTHSSSSASSSSSSSSGPRPLPPPSSGGSGAPQPIPPPRR